MPVKLLAGKGGGKGVVRVGGTRWEGKSGLSEAPGPPPTRCRDPGAWGLLPARAQVQTWPTRPSAGGPTPPLIFPPDFQLPAT